MDTTRGQLGGDDTATGSTGVAKAVARRPERGVRGPSGCEIQRLQRLLRGEGRNGKRGDRWRHQPAPRTACSTVSPREPRHQPPSLFCAQRNRRRRRSSCSPPSFCRPALSPSVVPLFLSLPAAPTLRLPHGAHAAVATVGTSMSPLSTSMLTHAAPRATRPAMSAHSTAVARIVSVRSHGWHGVSGRYHGRAQPSSQRHTGSAIESSQLGLSSVPSVPLKKGGRANHWLSTCWPRTRPREPAAETVG